jgi:hypothetical protein
MSRNASGSMPVVKAKRGTIRPCTEACRLAAVRRWRRVTITELSEFNRYRGVRMLEPRLHWNHDERPGHRGSPRRQGVSRSTGQAAGREGGGRDRTGCLPPRGPSARPGESCGGAGCRSEGRRTAGRAGRGCAYSFRCSAISAFRPRGGLIERLPASDFGSSSVARLDGGGDGEHLIVGRGGSLVDLLVRITE